MQWLYFVLGQVVNVFRQAHLVARSKPEANPVSSTFRWIHRNLIGLAVREVFAISLWLVATSSKAEGLVGVWFPQYAHFTSALVEIPFLAAPFGIVLSIASDYCLERWTWLKAHIPPLGE